MTYLLAYWRASPSRGVAFTSVSTALLGLPFSRKDPLSWEIRFPVYGRVNDMSPRLALRNGQWKFLMNPSLNRVELYNITEDPGEVDNLARGNPELVKKYTDYLLSWHSTLPDGPVHPDAGEKVHA